MGVKEVAEIIRSGDHPLRPIIDHYSTGGKIDEFAVLLEDPDLVLTVLYILRGISNIPVGVIDVFRKKNETGVYTGRALNWSQEIVDDFDKSLKSKPKC